MNSKISDKIIDWQAIMDICGDESVAQQVVMLSLRDAEEAVDFLSAAIDAGNCKDVRLYAHRLKGVALTIGARRFSEASYRLESAGKENDIQSARDFFDSLQAEFAVVKEFLSGDDWVAQARQAD